MYITQYIPYKYGIFDVCRHNKYIECIILYVPQTMTHSIWLIQQNTLFSESLKYYLIENDNFDAYMAAIGVGWVLRKAGAAASSTTAITDEGNS